MTRRHSGLHTLRRRGLGINSRCRWIFIGRWNDQRSRDLRILIVDDDRDTREMLLFILDMSEKDAAQAIAASSVAEARLNIGDFLSI